MTALHALKYKDYIEIIVDPEAESYDKVIKVGLLGAYEAASNVKLVKYLLHFTNTDKVV